jgi:FAD:protein FMN transferase
VDGRYGRRLVALAAGAIATSGIARRRWRQGGEERHHLIDPRTGRPAAGDLWSASVAATTCARAEVAATAAFVLGSARGAGFLASRRLPGLLVDRDGTAHRVAGWPAERQAAAA